MFAAPTQAITVQVQPTLDFQYVTFDAAVSGIVMTGQTLEIDFIFAGDGVALKAHCRPLPGVSCVRSWAPSTCPELATSWRHPVTMASSTAP
jgi:hypothetical protein